MSKKVIRIMRCAWCEKEGAPANMGTDIVDDPNEGGPNEGELMISHGICKRHKAEMLKELRKEGKKK
jgi:hypothetical protein